MQQIQLHQIDPSTNNIKLKSYLYNKANKKEIPQSLI